MTERLSHLLRSLFLRRRLEREMQDELTHHLDQTTERLMARGMSHDDARREAMREFGNVGYWQEEGRIARGTGWLDALATDSRYALRQFRRRPLTTVTILLVLALGIGLNSILFTAVRSYATQPPAGMTPADDLVRIRGTRLGAGSREARLFSLAEVEAYTELEQLFSAVAAWTSQPVPASLPGLDHTTLSGIFVTDNYFDVLGVRPQLGPGLPRDDDGSIADAAVISHTLWTLSFGADPAIVGRPIAIYDRQFTIVGVMPERFMGASREVDGRPLVWLPLPARPVADPAADDELFRAVARLRPGIDAGTATSAVEVVATNSTADDELEVREAPSADVVPLLAENATPRFEEEIVFMSTLFGALGILVLLVTSTNVSALQAGLALARRREIAIRISMGASRRRIIRQLVTEAVLLATLAGILCIALTVLSFRAIPLIWPGLMDFAIALDWVATAFTFAIAIGAGILFGLSPALHGTRVARAGALKDTAAAVAGARSRLQRGLVVAQIAFTQPLAVAVATLLALVLVEYRSETGNRFADRIVEMTLTSADASPAANPADPEGAARQRAEIDRLVQRLERMPGIQSAIDRPNVLRYNQVPFRVAGNASAGERDETAYLNGRSVSPGHLEIIGYPLVLGRDLVPADTAARGDGPGSALPAVIGTDMAQAMWGGANPIGRQLALEDPSRNSTTIEVVGVYEPPVARDGSADAAFDTYVPRDPARRSPLGYVMIRTAGDAESLLPAIRATVREELPNTAISSIQTLAAIEADSRYELFMVTALISGGGLVALFLSALGLYAVVSFGVGQRKGEIAVRMAIGAKGRQIIRHFAGGGMRLGVVGMLIGLPLSMFGLRLMLAAADNVPDISLLTIGAAVSAGVLLVAGLATWIPASRAAAVDPVKVLKAE